MAQQASVSRSSVATHKYWRFGECGGGPNPAGQHGRYTTRIQVPSPGKPLASSAAGCRGAVPPGSGPSGYMLPLRAAGAEPPPTAASLPTALTPPPAGTGCRVRRRRWISRRSATWRRSSLSRGRRTSTSTIPAERWWSRRRTWTTPPASWCVARQTPASSAAPCRSRRAIPCTSCVRASSRRPFIGRRPSRRSVWPGPLLRPGDTPTRCAGCW